MLTSLNLFSELLRKLMVNLELAVLGLLNSADGAGLVVVQGVGDAAFTESMLAAKLTRLAHIL